MDADLRMMDSLAAETIQRDEIDILIDLSGQTGGNRMPMFAYRPAPVQISSWIGFSTTSAWRHGLYAGRPMWPAREERFFTEKLCDCPKLSCFSPPHDAPAFQPALAAIGQITFGSLNNLAKMTDEVSRLGRDSDSGGRSKLLLRTTQLKSPEVRKTTQDRFARTALRRIV